MEKKLLTTLFIDEEVQSIKHARYLAKKAKEERNQLKGELLSLAMATPNDITPYGEDTLSYIKRKFNEIWGQLFDLYIDECKYTIVANDAEFEQNSVVQKQWNGECVELDLLKDEELKREFNDYIKFKKLLFKGGVKVSPDFAKFKKIEKEIE
jgi:hypothetical protein